MPQTDDFETFFDDADNETDTDSTAAVDATPTPSGAGPNRAARRGGKKGRKKPVAIPEGAPVPQDHLAKKDPRSAEADGGATIVLRLWDKTIHISQVDLLESWDFQMGTVQGNPLMMVKGLLGDRDFAWFAARARAEGKSPIDASSEVMSMFARATGFDSAGK
ncbi:hypothetical protein GS935_20330 [Rhodococcus hoagii]|nr:hypothetical protein [Prescottella equi]